MFGLKINEFDNSDGTINSFNKIFPHTKLNGKGDVEILSIVDSVYNRRIQVNGVVKSHDFGYNNFNNDETFQEEIGVQFKYFAKDLNGDLLVKGYSFDEIALELDVKVGVLKRRIKKPISLGDDSEHQFNITRIEI